MPKGVWKKPRPTAEDRLWARTDKSGPPHPVIGTPCWLWTGMTFAAGYGMIKAHGSTQVTHRLAWRTAVGEIPRGLFVLHRCDVRRCINPAHLFLGTHRDNMADMTAKERQAKGARHSSRTHPETVPRGEKHGRAIVSDAQVAEMRDLYRGGVRNHSVLGKRFGCSASQVWRIVSGQQRPTPSDLAPGR